MPEFNPQKLASLRNTLADFQKCPLREASEAMLSALGYKSDKTADFGSNPEQFVAAVEEATHSTFNRDKAHVSRWKQCAFLFQLTNDEIPSLAMGQQAFSTDTKLARSLIESFVFLAIELQGESWSRTDLAAIARELNRRFPMPAIVIFKHGLPSPAGGGGAGGEGISIVVIDRRANLKDAAKDVIDSRITVIKDVRIANPHRAHLDILAGLALENLGDKRRPTNFRELYDAWIEALSTQALNKRFYQELANWYFWALTQAQFPNDAPKDADGRDSLSLIRLITRIIFCWFLKEKGLLPNALFDPRIATLLGDYNPTESTYYKAILQNLFFATLNQEMDKREFRKAGQNFMAHNLYRYHSLMKNPDEVLKLLAGIPFMNGGLFECLDKTLGTREKPTYVRIDGFSDRDDNPLNIPNELFFGEERVVDLSGAYGDNKFKSAKATGLIHILDRYKFTVAENTPIEEEVALDPELLGKVFENLLAAYNPETGATARKQTGSFYTPREIVNYMVDESLIASLERILNPSPASGRGAGVRADAQPPHPHPPAKLPDDIRRYARELRTSQTDAESLLWYLLRNRLFLDLKFRRQHPEGRYILDFYCDELKLVIELDGSQHIEQADYDQARTEFLAKQGIRVLRFWNNQVLVETEGVLEAIYQAVMELQAPSPPAPLPLAGEGGAVARGEGGRTGEACSAQLAGEGSESRLRHLFAYNDQPHQFAPAEVEALIEAIDHLKILDPACGSGAFPMGVLHKLVFVLGKLDPGNQFWKARQLAKASEIPDATVRERVMDDIEQTFGANELDYGRKLYLIENCIYGVDIQPIAVQISKLRFFISLVVEQKINPQADNRGIRPLPNLETKFVAANSLIGLHRPAQQMLRSPEIDDKEIELRCVRERHFLARTPATKAKCREYDAALRAEIAELLKRDGWDNATARKISSWNPYDQNAYADFFDPEWMFGLNNGFDIVIGNPPYIFTRDADFSDDFKNHISANYFSLLSSIDKKSKANQPGKINLFALFILRGLLDAKKKGILSFIVPNNILRTTTYDLVRKYVLDNAMVEELVDLGSGVFDNVTASTIIFRLKNEKNNSNHKVKVVTEIKNIERQEFEKTTIEQNQFLKNVSYTFNIFADNSTNTLLTKIAEGKEDLGKFCTDIIAGIDAPKHLISESNTKNSFPLIEGKTIRKYGLHPIKKFIIWTTSEINRTRPDYIWSAPKKIVIQRISGGSNPLTATIDKEKNRAFNSVNSLLLKEQYENQYEFILALINSRVLNWYYANSFSNNSKLTVNISKTFLEKLPIPKVSKQTQNSITTLVDKILAAKRKNPTAGTAALEQEIDQYVYALYSLTPEEIKIVEESAPSPIPRKQIAQEVESEP